MAKTVTVEDLLTEVDVKFPIVSDYNMCVRPHDDDLNYYAHLEASRDSFMYGKYLEANLVEVCEHHILFTEAAGILLHKLDKRKTELHATAMEDGDAESVCVYASRVWEKLKRIETGIESDIYCKGGGGTVHRYVFKCKHQKNVFERAVK